MKRLIANRIKNAALCFALAAAVLFGTPMTGMAYTTATGIVSADAAKLRKEPSTESESLAGLLKGSTVTVVDEVTDSAGAVWYKVTVDNNSGYIRSDLLIKANSITTGSTVNGTSGGTAGVSLSAGTQAEKKPAPTTATPIAETKAYVNFESARIRGGASTDHDIVGSAVKNTPVTITGEAKGNDGKLWYQIKYTTSAGREVVGFIRSDLLTIGEPPAAEPETPAQEEPPAEETPEEEEGEGTEPEVPAEEPAQEPEEPVQETKPDYEMVFTANNEGVEEWYVYDNINGTRMSLQGLIAAAEAAAAQQPEDSSTLSTEKIIIIVLAVVAAILAVTVTLLLFKIRDLYDSEYEEDEEDEDEEDDEEEEEEDEEEEPVRRRVRAVKQEKEVRMPKERTEPTVMQSAPERNVKPAQPAVKPKRKAKNFLIDDDEFEFEFLNMEDKD